MAAIATFVFNDFQENTYVVYDDTGECVIIDPGCYLRNEKLKLTDFIVHNDLKPVMLLNTHCHIDHVLGNNYVSGKWKLDLWVHEKELPVLKAVPLMADMYGFAYEGSPEPKHWLKEGEPVKFGNTTMEVLFTPGHAPGHVVFYLENEKALIGGDVLFRESIGRTDLPMGDHDTLLSSIREKVLTLPDEVTVYSGHGPSTTIGHEKKWNPFVGEGE